MAKLTDEVSSFSDSQHYLLLDPDLKSHAEPLLAHWCDEVGVVVSEESMTRALHSVARLDVPLAHRQRFPELLRAFLEFLPSTGRFPRGNQWAERLGEMEAGYEASFRGDGSVRGATVRKAGSDTGRNDPCPCGSGRKYKKCCMSLLGS
ncbi:MAG: SEC-C metal-binding domain-containing protein [bacterium]|nr:SEC-C metal-binding domain-containing protein [bacterium]